MGCSRLRAGEALDGGGRTGRGGSRQAGCRQVARGQGGVTDSLFVTCCSRHPPAPNTRVPRGQFLWVRSPAEAYELGSGGSGRCWYSQDTLQVTITCRPTGWGIVLPA